jgi:hypothetical protein
MKLPKNASAFARLFLLGKAVGAGQLTLPVRPC